MEAIEAILSRRSIRRYKAELIPQDVILDLLKAAMSAPSSDNRQPWHFVVIDKRNILAEIPNFHPYSQMVTGAPLAIVICGDPGISETWVQDCSAATENLIIAVNAKGLGGVWLGVYPQEGRVSGIRLLLRLPEHIILLCIVSIGYPVTKKPAVNRFDPAKVHQDKW